MCVIVNFQRLARLSRKILLRFVISKDATGQCFVLYNRDHLNFTTQGFDSINGDIVFQWGEIKGQFIVTYQLMFSEIRTSTTNMIKHKPIEQHGGHFFTQPVYA